MVHTVFLVLASVIFFNLIQLGAVPKLFLNSQALDLYIVGSMQIHKKFFAFSSKELRAVQLKKTTCLFYKHPVG